MEGSALVDLPGRIIPLPVPKVISDGIALDEVSLESSSISIPVDGLGGTSRNVEARCAAHIPPSSSVLGVDASPSLRLDSSTSSVSISNPDVFLSSAVWSLGAPCFGCADPSVLAVLSLGSLGGDVCDASSRIGLDAADLEIHCSSSDLSHVRGSASSPSGSLKPLPYHCPDRSSSFGDPLELSSVLPLGASTADSPLASQCLRPPHYPVRSSPNDCPLGSEKLPASSSGLEFDFHNFPPLGRSPAISKSNASSSNADMALHPPGQREDVPYRAIGREDPIEAKVSWASLVSDKPSVMKLSYCKTSSSTNEDGRVRISLPPAIARNGQK